MINNIAIICIILAALIVFVRREMASGRFGFRRKTGVYRFGLDVFACGLVTRAYMAFRGETLELGAMIISMSVLVFTAALIFEAWQMEKPPSWWSQAVDLWRRFQGDPPRDGGVSPD